MKLESKNIQSVYLVLMLFNTLAASFIWGVNTLFLLDAGLSNFQVFAASMPVRQAYINGLIPSEQRATVLSFDSLIGSSGGVVAQPVLGKVADVWSYAVSYLVAGVFQILALPFVLLARAEKPKSDPLTKPKKIPVS